jgi:hypothetical protein
MTRWCRIGLHRWGKPVKVSVPLWDPSARGLLWRCTRDGCDGTKAR